MKEANMSKGLYLYRSNHLEVLSEIYAALIQAHPQLHPDLSPFRPINTIVGTPAMGHWLGRQLLDRHGIKAGVSFNEPPAKYIFNTLAMSQSVHDKGNPWAKEKLCWSISKTLANHLEHPDFAPVKQHLGSNAPGSRPWIELVMKLAQLFDHYLWYRPHWILNWENGGCLGAELPIHKWQATLWASCSHDIGNAHPDSPHLPSILLNGRSNQTNAPTDALYVFGLSRFPPAMLKALAILAETRDIHFFLLNPSDQYWADLSTLFTSAAKLDEMSEDQLQWFYAEALLEKEDGHPLLRQWGNQGRTNLFLIEQMLEGHIKKDSDYFIAPKNRVTSALSSLQRSICILKPPSTDERQIISEKDDSIQLHNCHNLSRQLETLKDALYRLFDRHPTLEPKDVLVLSPRFEEVSHLIPAIFGTKETERNGLPALPYHRIDIPQDVSDPMAAALLDLFELAQGRLDRLSVMSFLSKRVVRQHFNLSVDQTERVKDWIEKVSIRWGRDKSDRQFHQQPVSENYTWKSGLERMVLGIAMHADNDAPYGHVPLDDVEGSDAHVLLRAIRGITAIFKAVEECKTPASLMEWHHKIIGFCNALMHTDDTASRRFKSKTLSPIFSADSNEKWTSSAIAFLLSQRFKKKTSKRSTEKNAITFGSLYPERNLPYKVIALVGMDDGVFPGVKSAEGMNLMSNRPMPGDPNPAHENRYLLLEELLSAREHLLMFYTGRDERTNKDTPAAPPIQELKEILNDSFVLADQSPALDLFERKHPLHPFGIQAYQAKRFPELASYQTSTCPKPLTVTPKILTKRPDLNIEKLSLRSLVSFLRHPIRYQHQTLHNLHLSSWTDRVQDREPFVQDKHLAHEMAVHIICGLSRGESKESIRKTIQTKLNLPLGNIGTHAFESRYNATLPKWEKCIKNWSIPELPQKYSQHIFTFNNIQLSFEVPPIRSETVFFQQAKQAFYSKQMAFLQYCFAVASGLMTTETPVWLSLHLDSNNQPTLKAETLKWNTAHPKRQAEMMLNHYTSLYQRGLRGDLFALPKSGTKLVKECAKSSQWSRTELLSPSEEHQVAYTKLLRAVQKELKSGKNIKYGTFGDLDCEHILFEFPEKPDCINRQTGLLTEAFVHDSLDLWGAPYGLKVGEES